MTDQEQIEERQRGRKRKTDGNYASQYYDPDKAHEYYLKHRRLKLDAIKNGTSKRKSRRRSPRVKRRLPERSPP